MEGQGQDQRFQPPPNERTPQQQQPQYAQGSPMGASQPQRKPPDRKGFLEGMASNDGLSKAITIGLILLLVGVLIVTSARFITNYDSDALEDLDRDDEIDDEYWQQNLNIIGAIIANIGIFFIGLFLAIGGIYRDDLDTKYRIALVTLAVLFVLVTWFGFLDSVPII